MSGKGIMVHVVITFFLVMNLVMGLWGYHGGMKEVRREAVLKGHARYVADESGGAQFEWLEPVQGKEDGKRTR